MNDFDYDVLQKKRIAAGARHMKRGSRSKRCSLPSDNLTPAQLKRRNGPVSTYKLDAPMRWDDFRAMPEDLQKQYLVGLVDSYRATNEMLGDMFHVHWSTIADLRRNLGIGGKRGRLTDDEKVIRDRMWAAFCNGVVGGGDAVQETPREPEKEQVASQCPDELETAAMEPVETITFRETKLDLTEMSATFTGWFTADSFLNWLTKLPIPEAEVKIRVEVKRGEAV